MLPADLESRLEEWRRWALSGRCHRGQAGSAEGNFRSPQHWEQVTRAPGAPVATFRAYEVECVVVAMLDPFRWIIVEYYIRRQPDVVLRRKLRQRWRVSDHEAVLTEARRRVAAGLVRGDQHTGRLSVEISYN